MKTFSRIAAAAVAATSVLAPAAGAAEWPAGYRQLPAQAPYATIANQQDTVRCGVYNVGGKDFVHCLSLVDTMPGHQCRERYGQANAMNLGKGDAWDCADTNAFAGAPKMGNLQVRAFGDAVVASDARGNFYVADRGLKRVIRVGEVNDIYADGGHVLAFDSPLRGSSYPTGSSR